MIRKLSFAKERSEKRLKLAIVIKKSILFIILVGSLWLAYELWNMFFRSLLLVMSGIQLSSVRELKKLSTHNSIELEIAADSLTFFFLSAIIVSIVPIYYLLQLLKH